MKLPHLLNDFAKNESGAVTVDWVVLTAAIVGLGMLVISIIGPAIQETANVIMQDLETAANR
jgi:hypothetical protein